MEQGLLRKPGLTFLLHGPHPLCTQKAPERHQPWSPWGRTEETPPPAFYVLRVKGASDGLGQGLLSDWPGPPEPKGHQPTLTWALNLSPSSVWVLVSNMGQSDVSSMTRRVQVSYLN